MHISAHTVVKVTLMVLDYIKLTISMSQNISAVTMCTFNVAEAVDFLI